MTACSALAVIFTLASIIGTSQSLCLRETGPPYTHYTELGCTPIRDKDGCIERYDCPFMKSPLSPEKCTYKNQIYDIGEPLPRDGIDHVCTAGCNCIEGFRGKRAHFTCANIHCPEFLNPPGNKDCIYKYTFDRCCGTKICDKKAIAALKTCTWDSTVYREGQKFYPDDHCKQCICSKDFDGTIKAPWCKEINCGVELHDGSQAHTKCAPIYGLTNNCCPQTWQCFSATDRIERTTAVKNANPQMKCHYGDQVLEVGDKVFGEDKCIVCSCDIPRWPAAPDCKHANFIGFILKRTLCFYFFSYNTFVCRETYSVLSNK